MWKEGKLTTAWKESLVIQIHKPTGDRSNPESYQPISLTSVFCKLFERLIVTRLKWYFETKQLLNPLQSGFRRKWSTTDHLVRMQDCIHKALHNKKPALAIFLDFSKAFDMVWKKGRAIYR